MQLISRAAGRCTMTADCGIDKLGGWHYLFDILAIRDSNGEKGRLPAVPVMRRRIDHGARSVAMQPVTGINHSRWLVSQSSLSVNR
jgi:hypothetical protein